MAALNGTGTSSCSSSNVQPKVSRTVTPSGPVRNTALTRVYTDKAVLLTGPEGVTVRETFGCSLEELQELVPVPLKAAPAA